MSETVKRYAVIGFGHKQLVEHEDGRYVLATDYARLEQECERLRADLRFLSEYIAAESSGHPLPNYLAIGRFPVDVARAALSAKP